MAQNTQPQQGKPGQKTYPGPNNPNASPNKGDEKEQKGGQQQQKGNQQGQQNLGGLSDRQKDLTKRQGSQNPELEEDETQALGDQRLGDEQEEEDEQTQTPQSNMNRNSGKGNQNENDKNFGKGKR